jgi:lysophospholipase L1-like esterase
MRTLFVAVALLLVAVVAQAEVMFTDSFETLSELGWQTTWGKAERTQEMAQDGKWAVKETVEDKYGLSVWYIEFPATPGATYRASAWVYVPEGQALDKAALALSQTDWQQVAQAVSTEPGKWVQLKVEYRNLNLPRLRLQLFQSSQRAGHGGCVMYWDNVTLEREMGELTVQDGIRINPYVRKGLDVTPAGGMKIRVAPGTIDVDGVAVTVAAETVLELAPARTVSVRDEALTLSEDAPKGWGKGTSLRGCVSRGTTLAGCLVPDSLVIKAAAGPEGRRLVEGTDWRADKLWGKVGRMPEGPVSATTTVYADYDYSLLRVDTLEVRSDGKVVLRTGAEHKSIPEPPAVDAGARALCNIYLPYHCTELTAAELYPVGIPFPEPGQEELQARAATVAKAREKLEAGGDFNLVFWGDSVTCGGDSSVPEKMFTRAFTTWLRDRYPQTRINSINSGTGGWNSQSKLPLFQQEVLDKKPDLVIIEFVNDMGMGRDQIFRNYTEAVSKIRAQGGDVIILTPHFTRPDMMGTTDLRTGETRAAVGFLKEFAAENNVGLADASRRWAHLWQEGLPYMTLLNNGINHPDDRGHWLFVQELQEFFR